MLRSSCDCKRFAFTLAFSTCARWRKSPAIAFTYSFNLLCIIHNPEPSAKPLVLHRPVPNARPEAMVGHIDDDFAPLPLQVSAGGQPCIAEASSSPRM